MKIRKYDIPFGDEFSIEMPAGQVLCVQMQHNRPHIWVKTEEHNDNFITRNFKIVGTGQLFDDNGLLYIGTFQEENGALIWHLFERETK